MKTIVSLLVLFTFSITTTAQIKKGQWMTGGIADFSHTSSDINLAGLDQENKAYSYRVAPGFGYFFMDKFCGGLRLNISGAKSTEQSNGLSASFIYISSAETKTSGAGISPFVRYYFLPVSAKLNLFADASYIYNSETTKSKLLVTQQTNPPGGIPPPGSTSESRSSKKYNGNYYSLAAGPVIFISPKVSFELSLGYTIGKVKQWNQTTDKFTIGTGFQVHFGK
ncbi:MAG: hypothetical protein WDO16_25360 [Bacteroidota bacterium]